MINGLNLVEVEGLYKMEIGINSNSVGVAFYRSAGSVELLQNSAGSDDTEATNVNLLRRFAIERCCKHEAPNGAS